MDESLVRYESGDDNVAQFTLPAPPADTCSDEMMREQQQQLFESEDAAEGLAASLEKRPPRRTDA